MDGTHNRFNAGRTFPSATRSTLRGFLVLLLGVTAATLMIPIASSIAGRGRQLAGIFTGYTVENHNWLVAMRLRESDIRPGDKVTSIGRAFDGYWARLAGVQIAMEINESDASSYWAASDSLRWEMLRTFVMNRATAVVMKPVPEGERLPAMLRLADDAYAFLPPADSLTSVGIPAELPPRD